MRGGWGYGSFRKLLKEGRTRRVGKAGYDVHDEENDLREAWIEMFERPRVMKRTPGVDEDSVPIVMFLARAKGFLSFTVNIEPGKDSFIMKHAHQYDAAFYVLEGKGYEIHDGKRYDWEAGDAFFVSPGGCTHQHLNADPDRPARLLIFTNPQSYDSLNLIADGLIDMPEGHTRKEYHDTMLKREGAVD